MAQSGYTPILIYASGTTGNAPSAGNLTSSASGAELALNYFDGKLFYKDASGNVQLLASKAGASGDVVGPSSATDNALARFDTTTGKLIQNSVGILSDAGVLTGLTGLTSSGSITFSSLTSGRVPYATTAGLLTDSANLLYSGTDLTVYGLTVGRGAGAVSTNTAVGASALAAVTTAIGSTAIGYTAGASNQSGSNLTAVGRDAATSNTTGAFNNAFGANSLRTNTTGGYNTAIGEQSLYSNTTASNNTAVGYQAGYSNTTGTNVNAFGQTAAYSNTTGEITAIGSSSLYSNTTGTLNTAVGAASLYANTTGGSNVAVGRDSLRSNTTASNNTAVGYQAGYSNTTGTYNTFLGHQAGYNVTTGSYNTIVGRYDGNTGGPDIRTANNYIILSDGSGTARGGWDNGGNFHSGEWAHTDGSMFYSTATALNAYRASAVVGNGIFGMYSDVGGTKTVRAYFTANGGLSNYSANNINLSDERLKKDISLAGSYLNKICAIPVKNFRYKDQSESEDITLGVIAQDVLAVAPELVSQEGFGLEGKEDFLSVYQTDLQYALMKSIQELNAKVDAQAAEIAVLKGKA